MIKKIVIPAAGKGTRMLDLARELPKHLINVLDQPFLYYLLQNIREAGFEEMILVIGHHKEKMEEFAQKYKDEFNITLVNQFEVLGKGKYGTACPIEAAEKTVGNESFVSVYGDNLYSVDDLKAMKIDDEYCYAGGLVTEHPEKYGVIISDEEGFIKEVIEKPQEYVGDIVNIGIYKFTPDIFKAVKQVGLSPRGEYELTDAVSILAREHKAKLKKITGYWLDFGRPEDVEKVAKFLEAKGNR